MDSWRVTAPPPWGVNDLRPHGCDAASVEMLISPKFAHCYRWLIASQSCGLPLQGCCVHIWESFVRSTPLLIVSGCSVNCLWWKLSYSTVSDHHPYCNYKQTVYSNWYHTSIIVSLTVLGKKTKLTLNPSANNINKSWLGSVRSYQMWSPVNETRLGSSYKTHKYFDFVGSADVKHDLQEWDLVTVDVHQVEMFAESWERV